MQNISKNLIERFEKYKNQYKKYDINYGWFWNEAKKSFDVEFNSKGYKNLGSRDYFPQLFSNQIDKAELIDINIIDQDKKFLKIGEKKIVFTHKSPNDTIIYIQYFYNLISKYIREKDIICEVGPGSGLFSGLIHSKKNTVNILIDIPSVLLTSISLLFTLFPKKKFILPNEISDYDDFKNYDFIFLTPNQIDLIPDNYVDLGINTQSFQEMEKHEIRNYLIFFNRVIGNNKHFFTSNRVKKVNNFFSYPWSEFKHFKKIYLQLCEYHKNKKTGSNNFNLILQKNNKIQYKFLNLRFFERNFSLRFLKKFEKIYWIKEFILFFFRKLPFYAKIKNIIKNRLQ